MSQTSPTPNQRLVTELKVSAHTMLLDPGVFCVFHAPGTQPPDAATGLPGVRISRAPSVAADAMHISTFNPDGWLGGESGAALVRVVGAQAQVLVTIYQSANSAQDAPKLQVLRLSDQAAPVAAPAAAREAPAQAAGHAQGKTSARSTPQSGAEAGAQPGGQTGTQGAAPAAGGKGAAAAGQQGEKPEVAAHVQRRGDLLTRVGDWMGERGSQNWIEGFAIQPAKLVEPADVEYQAVLGKGWLSPWAEGGKYCGSRGMALPILGLRVRLKGEAAEKYAVRVHATFIDGSAVGPVDGTQTAETETLAPLEAFKVEFVPLNEDAEAPAPTVPVAAPARASAAVRAGAPAAKSKLAKPVRAIAPRAIQTGTHPSAKNAGKQQPAPTKTGRSR